MSWTNLVKLASKNAIIKPWLDGIVDNFAFLFSQVGEMPEAILINGSFENDIDANGIPDTWSLTLLQAGAAARETSSVFHGEASFKFTRALGASNGGGVLQSDHLTPCAEGILTLECFYSATAALKSKIEIEFFDKARTTISTGTAIIQEQTAQKRFTFDFTAPARARFFRAKITGGATDVNVAGDAIFDGLRLTHKYYDYADFAPCSFTANGTTSYATVGTMTNILIPESCTTIKIKLKITNNSTNAEIRTRFVLSGSNSSESAWVSTGTSTQEMTLAVPEAVKGTLATVTLQSKIQGSSPDGLVGWESSFANGREANLIIE